jgi:hypothetical protein
VSEDIVEVIGAVGAQLAWTDAGQADPFVVLSAGRAVSRFEDLLRLVKLIEDLKASTVKEIKPNV